MSTPPKVALKGITKRYGPLTVNDGIDLDILAGEFLTLLGSSGSGKTTLMRIVAGLEMCDSGTVYLDGRDVTREPPRRRDLGMVFQQYSLFPHMTVAENIRYGLRVKRWKGPDAAKRVAEMLEMVQLPQVANRYPHQLSGGQQQRVALARALATSPQVLMLDEPLGALDLKLRKQLQVELKRIHRQTGTTFLFVTHDQEEALSMSDRVAVLKNGKIEQLGDTRSIYQAPQTAFVADFIGEVSLVSCDRSGAPSGMARIDGTSYEIRIPADSVPGRFKLVVRPEHVLLHKDASIGGIPGRIADVGFEGGSSLIRVDLDNGPTVKARVLGLPESATEIGQRVWAEIAGATVCLPAA
ncbi:MULTISPECIES: ABC transporter ATP-binding protein [unclassified Beijerinckia]|uniref:ABC transporter ATP-binding protein n=1 Tax=unclassified Beijerinckia TaxID=2638183 RepID=UPI001481CACC|nr:MULTISPECIES: ABC transporter ATP-binding protein [unclassified Beijerinckia]